MKENAIKKFHGIIDWKGYIIQLVMPYEKWKVDANLFAYDQIHYILNIIIRIRYTNTLAIIFEFHGFEKYRMIINIMKSGMSIGYFHYETLKEIVQQQKKNISLLIESVNENIFI